MELTITALSRNLLNHPNLALPTGKFEFYGVRPSTAQVSTGGHNPSGNRRNQIPLEARFLNKHPNLPRGKKVERLSVNFPAEQFPRAASFRC